MNDQDQPGAIQHAVDAKEPHEPREPREPREPSRAGYQSCPQCGSKFPCGASIAPDVAGHATECWCQALPTVDVAADLMMQCRCPRCIGS